MKVAIWLLDQKKLAESEMTGVDSDVNSLTDFYFKIENLVGFWIDFADDDGSRDIIFYVGGDSFRTPYKKALAEKFYKDLEAKKKAETAGAPASERDQKKRPLVGNILDWCFNHDCSLCAGSLLSDPQSHCCSGRADFRNRISGR